MLDSRKEVMREQSAKEPGNLAVYFKTPQQQMPNECIALVFQKSSEGFSQLIHLHDWYYTGSFPEYRFETHGPNPEDSEKLQTIGGGW